MVATAPALAAAQLGFPRRYGHLTVMNGGK
jgi:hypothetical protein